MNMKKPFKYLRVLLVLMVATIFFACNLEDEEAATLSPPSWIMGVWSNGESGDLEISFEFTADNVMSKNLGETLSLKEIYGGSATDSSGTSPRSYTVLLKSGDTRAGIYYFESVESASGTTIRYWIQMNPLSDTIDKSKTSFPEGIPLTKQ